MFTLALVSLVWSEASHRDFADGREYFYLGGDTASFWNPGNLRTWRLGSHIYSPAGGGLRIIGQDLDIDDDGFLDLPVANWFEYPIWIYWGPDLSERSEINKEGNPPTWAQGIFIADLDGDAVPEILVASDANYENITPASGIYKYIGNRSFRLVDSIPYPFSCGAQALHPTDLNNDGYLDLVISNSRDYVTNNWEVNSYVFLGPGPFSNKFPRWGLPTFGGHPSAIADLNGDGFLDILFPSNADTTNNWETHMIIYWGHEDGSYGTWDTTRLPAENNWECQTADLNGDGWLDIVEVNGKDNTSYHTYDRIYWGPDFRASTKLPGIASSNLTLADVDRDGVLDILISNWATGHHGAETLAVFSYLRYGPDYVHGRVDSFRTLGAHGNIIADFNGDGWPDIFVGNEMSSWGHYYNRSYVFWNSPSGVDWENPTEIETHAANDGVWCDLGNLYERKPTERYLSSVQETWYPVKALDSLRVFGNVPGNMGVDAWVRTGNELAWNPWVRIGPDARPQAPVSGGNRLQYRLVISLDYKTTTLFRVDSVKVFYTLETTTQAREEAGAGQGGFVEFYDVSGRFAGRDPRALTRGIYFKVRVSHRQRVSLGPVLVR